jgi:phosphonate transport system substrate-binding protein
LPAARAAEERAHGMELRFSAIPDQNSTELEEKYGLLARHLAGVLGVEVRYVPSSDYSASVESFVNGDVQLAWFGGLTGVRARAAVEGARAIAQGAVDPHFRTYFIAHVDAGVEPSVSEFAVALLVAFSTLVAGRLLAGQREGCGCFGAWSTGNLSWRTLARNTVLVAVGVVATLD